MRTAITLARKHGEKHSVVVCGPEVPVQVQITEAKRFAAAAGKVHPEYAEVELWTSSEGRIKLLKFGKPGERAPMEIRREQPPVAIIEPVESDVAPVEPEKPADETVSETESETAAPASSETQEPAPGPVSNPPPTTEPVKPAPPQQSNRRRNR
ncbi:MAG TPA: hypothetical protein VJS88_06105 [Chthoniobacterales bacterium]|nr:hypothetical protein [Chthoniobacterales bacterium]